MTDESTSLISDQWTLILIWSWGINFVISILGIATQFSKTKLYIPPNFKQEREKERSVDLELSLFVTKEKEWAEANRPINPLESRPREAADWLSVTISSSVFPIRPLSDYSTRAFRSTHYDNTRSQYIERKERIVGEKKIDRPCSVLWQRKCIRWR